MVKFRPIIMDSSSSISSNLEFFKVFLPNSSSQHMSIPPAFVKFFNGSIPGKAVLRDYVGKSWDVTLEKLKNCVFFKNGWQEFADEHYLKYGDFLIFHYDGSHVFDVKIFGKNGCKKELVLAAASFFPNVKIKDEPHLEEDNSKPFSPCKRKHSEGRLKSSSDTVHKSRRTSKTDLGKLSASETADHVSTIAPVFEHRIRNWSHLAIYIPNPVLIRNNILLESDMVLVDENGRSWPVTVKTISRHRSAITTGWSVFFREKKLGIDDKCSFEFLLGRRNICKSINVKIYRSRARTRQKK